jgi:PAS domain S-box-containing protein
VIRDNQGNPSHIISIGRDTTERRKAEQSLRESAEMYRNLLESFPDIVMRFDRECRHLFVSQNVRQFYPRDAEEFIGKTHRELGFPDEEAQFWEKAITGVFKSTQPYETEFSFDGINGVIIFNWRLVPEYDSLGNMISVLSMSRDITHLRKVEQDYQILFAKMIDGFALHEIICDKEGTPIDYRFLDLNPAFQH